MRKILNTVKNTNGVFARAFDLGSEQPSTGLCMASFDELRIKRRKQPHGFARDSINFLADRRNLVNDVKTAIKAAKEKIGI